MRAASPKYIPREWMLASAYTAAERGDHTVLNGGPSSHGCYMSCYVSCYVSCHMATTRF